MPDDENMPEAPPEPTEQPLKVEPPRVDPAVEALGRQVAALNDTVAAALQARSPVDSGGTLPPGSITPQLRQALMNHGLSAADIEHNAPIILPFVKVLAPELFAAIEMRAGPIDERVARREMEEDGETYPYAKDLRKEIKSVMDAAKKEQRGLSLEAAYHTAVSMNLDKVRQIESTRRAESVGADASAMSGLGHRTSSNASGRSGRGNEPKTAQDLASMSRAERLAYFEKTGDAPIH